MQKFLGDFSNQYSLPHKYATLIYLLRYQVQLLENTYPKFIKFFLWNAVRTIYLIMEKFVRLKENIRYSTILKFIKILFKLFEKKS